MKISTLLRLHDSPPRGLGLDANLGDSLLCERNVWFRTIRRLALAQGVAFERTHALVNPMYQCLPLLALECILDHDVVPYHDNVAPLRRLVDSDRDFDAPVEFLLGDFRRNYVLHEASHCVAHRVLCGGEPSRLLARRDSVDFRVRSLLSEAFANSVESLALGWAPDGASALLLTLNTYRTYTKDQLTVALSAVDLLGLRSALEVSMWAFFAAHVAPSASSPDDATAARLRALAASRCAGARDASEAVDKLGACAFSLEPAFRTSTASSYFRYLGVRGYARGEAADVLNLGTYLESDVYRRCVSDLIDQVVSLLEQDGARLVG